MVNTTEQILLTLGARNNASNVFGQVDKDAKSMASSISSTISNLNNGLMNIGSVTDNMMQGLTGKSAMDNILGTTSKAETNKVLLKNMLDDTEKHYDSFYDKVDKTTDSSLTSMQELIPALKFETYVILGNIQNVSYCEFDEEFAPEGWKKGRNDSESIIFFKYTGKLSDYETVDDFYESVEVSVSQGDLSAYDVAEKVRDDSL